MKVAVSVAAQRFALISNFDVKRAIALFDNILELTATSKTNF